ncbi:MAG: hypothetical protein FWD31_01275 [Planctomycetaceae bacterium]|nr:hypothetical protein [Planctomycetaceae bacterium]
MIYCLRQGGLPLRVAGRTGTPVGKPGDDTTSATRIAGLRTDDIVQDFSTSCRIFNRLRHLLAK